MRHVLPRASVQDQVTRQRFAAGSPPSRQSASFRWADQPPIPKRIGNFGGRSLASHRRKLVPPRRCVTAAPLTGNAYELCLRVYVMVRHPSSRLACLMIERPPVSFSPRARVVVLLRLRRR